MQKINGLEDKVFDNTFKVGLKHRLTEKGAHYFKTLRAQYLQGLPIKNQKLMVLSVLLIHSDRFTSKDFVEGQVLIEEIQDTIGDFDSTVVRDVLCMMGHLEDNPAYIAEIGEAMANTLQAAIDLDK